MALTDSSDNSTTRSDNSIFFVFVSFMSSIPSESKTMNFFSSSEVFQCDCDSIAQGSLPELA